MASQLPEYLIQSDNEVPELSPQSHSVIAITQQAVEHAHCRSKDIF